MRHDEWRFWDAVDRVREGDGRYRREAYGFVVGALGVTVAALPVARRNDPVRRHLGGRELLEGIAALAQREFGFLAPTVFSEWGVSTSEDIGRIVSQLVECRQLSVSPEDSFDDFRGFDLAGGLAAGGHPTPRRDESSGEATDQPGSGAGSGSGSGPEPAR